MNNKAFIIAEVGVNHNGNLCNALKLIQLAAKIGADAVKFQTFSSKALCHDHLRKANYQISNDGSETSQREMLERLEMPHDWYPKLIAECDKYALEFMSTPFDIPSLFFLKQYGLKYWKVGSGELTNIFLLIEYGRLRSQIILSTGMANVSEVEVALAAIVWGWKNPTGNPVSKLDMMDVLSDPEAIQIAREYVVIMHCVSAYPCPDEAINLRAMVSLGAIFGCRLGFSDHTPDGFVAPLAIALGAVVYEKHITLSRSMDGPDHRASLEPREFEELIANIRRSFEVLGSPVKSCQPCERDVRDVARQKVIVAQPIRRGEIVEINKLSSTRAQTGLVPESIMDFIGNQSKGDYEPGDIFWG